MEADRLLLKGFLFSVSGAVFFTYAYAKETHILPIEIIKLIGTCTALIGLFFIGQSFYCKFFVQPQEAQIRLSDNSIFTRSNQKYFTSYAGPKMQPVLNTMNSTMASNTTRNNIYTPRSEELAETFLRTQNPNYNQGARHNLSSTYQFGNAMGGPRMLAGNASMILNPVHYTNQAEPDYGISCNREGMDKPFSKVALFTDLPMNREISGGSNRLFPHSYADDQTSRRDSAMRTQHRQSTSMHRSPWGADRTYVGSNRSASPMFRAESHGFASVRPLMKKSTVMMKETTSIYSNLDKRTLINQGNYSKAMESLATVGGDELTFNQSMKSLHNWISHKLLEKYYEENRKNLMAINNVLMQFNKQLFEIDLLKEDRIGYTNPQQVFEERARLNKIENVSLNKLYTIYCSINYSPSKWTSVLGEVNAKTSDEATKLNKQMDKEMTERARLDVYLRIPDTDIQSIRSFCLSCIKNLRGYSDFNKFYQPIRPKPHLPSPSEIILSIFVTFVLENHPNLSINEDYAAIFQSAARSIRSNNSIASFKIRKSLDDSNFYCELDGNEVVCLEGVNNAVSVCIYLLHYVKQEKTSGSDLAAMQKTYEGQKLDGILKGITIGGRFKNIN